MMSKNVADLLTDEEVKQLLTEVADEPSEENVRLKSYEFVYEKLLSKGFSLPEAQKSATEFSDLIKKICHEGHAIARREAKQGYLFSDRSHKEE